MNAISCIQQLSRDHKQLIGRNVFSCIVSATQVDQNKLSKDATESKYLKIKSEHLNYGSTNSPQPIPSTISPFLLLLDKAYAFCTALISPSPLQDLIAIYFILDNPRRMEQEPSWAAIFGRMAILWRMLQQDRLSRSQITLWRQCA
jgi:hypothetical protein